MANAFLALDDVEDVYSCELPSGGRVRVVLDDKQREVLKRMQRIRRVSGAERAEVLRNPYSAFDGLSDAVEIDLQAFGPRVKGVGDFPFVARPYLQGNSGVLEDDDQRHSVGSAFSFGLDCESRGRHH